jgi:LacI family transcriptional regulator
MPTIKDVARTAGVSPATVSRVLSGKDSVDPELARRVRATALELDYRPSSVARSLRTKRRAVWGIIVSDIRNPFFTELVRGVEDAAQQAGYALIVGNADERYDKEASYVDLFVAERMAGVILSPASQAMSDVGPLLDHAVPVITVDRELHRTGVDSVLVDNEGGGYQATKHLLLQGYGRIACITGPADRTTASSRLAGYVRAHREAGLPIEDELVRRADFKETGGAQAAENLLALSRPPDALFVTNNQMTLGALDAISRRGLKVPDDLGIVGFDDPPWAGLICPPLTAVAQPAYDIGATAADLLVRRIARASDGPERIVLPTSLIVRASSVREDTRIGVLPGRG